MYLLFINLILGLSVMIYFAKENGFTSAVLA